MESAVKMEEIQGRGRAMLSTRPLKAGEIVLMDSPILLYSAFPLSQTSPYCDFCFRKLQPATALPCPHCSHYRFCNSNCLAFSSHTPWVCQALRCLRDCPSLLLHHPPERQVQARFLVAAYNLAIVSPSNFQILLSLQGQGGNEEDAAAAQLLHSLIWSLCPPPNPNPIQGLELASALLAKDKLNAFGLMEPFDMNRQERSVRAYGVYPKAALFNHDCLPNACRFDYVDAAPDSTGNTDIIVRMIHDVPQGREVCLSYFPVNWDYSTRQKRLLEDYGFNCDCDRCKVEANWSDEEESNGDGGNDDEDVMEEDADEPMDGDNDASTDFPHAYFFLRFMCNRPNCWGTLAPLPSKDSLLECNVCGNIKKDEVVDGDADGGQGSFSMDG